jgi:predicted NodU family carbamoyl transferase
MKNGYYLSAYVEIDEIGNLYKFAHRHDHCIALWKKTDNQISLEDYWELERFTGMKQHSMALFDVTHFKLMINQLLKKHNLNYNDIIETWGVPQLNGSDHYLSKHKFENITYHAMCHLASALFMDMEKFKNENLLAFVVDGGSDIVIDKDTASKIPFIGCWSDRHGIEIFPVYSPGFLWDSMRCYFDIREGTLMALASASKSEAYIEVEDILVENNVTVEKEKYEQVKELINKVEGLTQEDAGIKFNYFDPRFSERDNKISMIMKIIQRMSERIMKMNIESAIHRYNINTKDTYLVMSGGFALNCPCNTYLMDEYGFKGFIAPPCVSDSGMALGIGLYSFYNELGKNFEFKLKNAYYGGADELDEFLKKAEYDHYIESIEEFDETQAVADIEEAPVIWFSGRAEMGPRALGARSILGDPRKAETKDKLNEIKLRQWWRPVAPIVLLDQQQEWFENSYESPYMLQVLKIRPGKEELIPAIAHEDKTARAQTIDEESGQKLLLKLIKAFHNKTGVPILCNTSLNDKGEPIINRIEEAVNFALRKGIRVTYFNGKRVLLKNHKDYEKVLPLKRVFRTEVWKNKEERENLVEVFNPYNADNYTTLYYVYTKINNPALLADRSEVKKLKIRSKIFFKSLSPFLKPIIDSLCTREM